MLGLAALASALVNYSFIDPLIGQVLDNIMNVNYDKKILTLEQAANRLARELDKSGITKGNLDTTDFNFLNSLSSAVGSLSPTGSAKATIKAAMDKANRAIAKRQSDFEKMQSDALIKISSSDKELSDIRLKEAEQQKKSGSLINRVMNSNLFEDAQKLFKGGKQ